MLNVFCCKSQKFTFNKTNFIMNLVGKHVKMSEVVGKKTSIVVLSQNLDWLVKELFENWFAKEF